MVLRADRQAARRAATRCPSRCICCHSMAGLILSSDAAVYAAERIAQHRQKHRGYPLRFCFIVLPNLAQGASTAKSIEADCINRLVAANIPVLSVHDARGQKRRLH